MKAAASTKKNVKKCPEKQEETHGGGGTGSRVGSPGRKLEGLSGLKCPVPPRAQFTLTPPGLLFPSRHGLWPTASGTCDSAPPAAVNWSRDPSSIETTPGSLECHLPHGLGSRQRGSRQRRSRNRAGNHPGLGRQPYSDKWLLC